MWNTNYLRRLANKNLAKRCTTNARYKKFTFRKIRNANCLRRLAAGADNRTWTCTELPRLEPESSASANSAISAYGSDIFTRVKSYPEVSAFHTCPHILKRFPVLTKLIEQPYYPRYSVGYKAHYRRSKEQSKQYRRNSLFQLNSQQCGNQSACPCTRSRKRYSDKQQKT